MLYLTIKQLHEFYWEHSEDKLLISSNNILENNNFEQLLLVIQIINHNKKFSWVPLNIALPLNFMSALINFDRCNDIYIQESDHISMKTIEIVLIPYSQILQQKKEQTLKCRDSEKPHELLPTNFFIRRGAVPQYFFIAWRRY